MHFEPKIASAAFQIAMDAILAIGMWVHEFVDDIISLPLTPGDRIKHVKSVLRIINKADITLKMKMCNFFSDAVDYFRHMITMDRQHVAKKRKDHSHI